MLMFPSAEEQLNLEYINRARADPHGEFDLLISDAATQTAVSDDITSALRFFDVDMSVLDADLASYPSVAPLAWNANLAQSARNHSMLMIAEDTQSHNLPGEPGLRERFDAAGYTGWNAISENIFAYGKDALHTHAAFYIDWGHGPTGLQDPAGHRDALLSERYTEIGISMLPETDPATAVGPYVVTEHLGNRVAYQPQLLGVIIDDTDADGFYDIGEGLGDVTVSAVAENGTRVVTSSWASGGYQLALTAGSYDVTFSGDLLDGDITNRVTMTEHNLKLDVFAADAVLQTPVWNGGPDDDNHAGSAGNDTMFGKAGSDTLFGGAGDDTLDGGTGADYMNGGPGSDRIIVDDAGDRVAESRKWDGHDTVESSVDFRMGRKHIEDLELTGDARLGAGNGLTNRITGNDANNILDGGRNNDTLEGGRGDDRYILRTPGDVIVEQAGEGNDVVLAYQSYALAAHVEQLFMQTVRTKDGDPAIFNGIGNGLDNTIIGTPFANTIVGREGKDTLKGQRGADTFVFDRAIGPDNVDRIIDFNVNEAAEGDRLLMKGSVFGGMAAGGLAADAFATGTAAQDANDRFIFDQGSGRLWFDADGAGAGDQVLIATFEQNATVTAGDIEVF